MIEQLEGHIAEWQIEMVVEIIRNQYQEYLDLINTPAFTRIFAEEYAPHKRQHGVSWAISSAFPSNTTVANSLQVERLLYGKGHTRPVLKNDTIELHILNKTTHFTANYLKERYQNNANGFTGIKLFAYIKFSVENRKLVSVSLCLPDESGNVIEEVSLLNRDVLRRMAA